MGSVLRGIGNFAGGVASGIEKQSEINARNQAARAAREEADRKAETYQNEQAYLGLLGPANDPTTTFQGNETAADVAARNLAKWKDDETAAAKARTPMARLGALGHDISGVFSRKGARTTAQAAGVQDVGLPGMPGPTAPPAPPAPAAPPDVAGGALGAPPTEVEPLEVQAAPRQWTARDRAQYKMVLATHFKQKDAAKEAFAEYKDLTVAEERKAIRSMPWEEVGTRLSVLSGEDIETRKNADGTADIYIDGQLDHKGADRQYVDGWVKSHLDENPEAGFAAMEKADNAHYVRAGQMAEIKRAEAQTEEARARVKRIEAAGPLQDEKAKLELTELKQEVADRDFISDPDNVSDPTAYEAAARRLQARDEKHGNTAVNKGTVVVAPDGTRSVTYSNPAVDLVNDYRRRFAASEERKQQHIGLEREGGKLYFRVKDPTTGEAIPQRFSSFVAAEERSKKLWQAQAPQAPAPQAPAAGPGKTVTRRPVTGLGVNPSTGRAQPLVPAGP